MKLLENLSAANKPKIKTTISFAPPKECLKRIFFNLMN